VNSSGNPYLAQGGSGDLLAGFLGGLLGATRFAEGDDPNDLLRGLASNGVQRMPSWRRAPTGPLEELADVLGSVPAQPAISPPA